MNKLPETIYVKIEYDGDDDFLIAGEVPSDISESEDSIEVGMYSLVATKTVTNKTILEN